LEPRKASEHPGATMTENVFSERWPRENAKALLGRAQREQETDIEGSPQGRRRGWPPSAKQSPKGKSAL